MGRPTGETNHYKKLGKAPRDLPPGGVETVSLMVTKGQGLRY